MNGKNFMHTMYAFLLCVIFVACSKDSDTPELPNNNDGKRVVSSIMLVTSSQNRNTLQFSYNEQGLISKLDFFSNNDDETDNNSIDVLYNSDKIIARAKYESIEGIDYETYTATLSGGKIVKLHYDYNDKEALITYRNDCIYSITQYGDESSEESNIFEWKDGNLIEYNWSNNYSQNTWNTVITYTDLSIDQINLDLNYILYNSEELNFALCDPIFNSIFLSQNLMGQKNKSLVKSIKDEGTSVVQPYYYNYKYTLDEKGCPLKVTINDSMAYYITYLD